MKRSLKLPLMILALMVVSAVIAHSNPQRIEQPLPPALSRLSDAKLVEVKDATGRVILTGSFATTSETKKEIERTAALTGSGVDPDAKGKAEIELMKKNDMIAEQELEMAVERLAPTASFKFYVDGNEVITFTTNKSGKASMKFSSKYSKK